MEDKIFTVMFSALIVLEIIIILSIVSKIKKELKYLRSGQKLSAVVRRISENKASFPQVIYSFEVKADNGYIYKIISDSFKAAMITEGDTVQILVPEDAYGWVEDEHFEAICSQGKAALKNLSEGEKKRLSKYLSGKIESSIDAAKKMNTKNIPRFTFDGGGLKKDIIPMCAIASVVAVVIIAYIITHIK